MIRNNIQKPLIIIGMHRSGTSLVADALNNAGICMGVFREHNSEAMHFLSINQQMLAAHGADWLNPRVIEDFNLGMNAHQLYAEHVKSRFDAPWRLRLAVNKRWGFKDPRNTFTILFWLKLYPQARVLHVLRDARAVVASLMQRNTIAGEVYDPRLNDAAFCFHLWEVYVKQALAITKKYPQQSFTIKYEDILAGNEAEIAALQHFCAVKPIWHLKQIGARNFSKELNQLAANSKVFAEAGYVINKTF